MKKILLLITLMIASVTSFAQSKYEYCELSVKKTSSLSENYKAYVTTSRAKGHIKNELGKTMKFKTTMGPLKFMADRGWKVKTAASEVKLGEALERENHFNYFLLYRKKDQEIRKRRHTRF